MSDTIITIKIGRHSYDIDEVDRFMDNGVCIQLISQSKERGAFGRVITPVLSKRAAKGIAKFKRVGLKSIGISGTQTFGLLKG